MLQQIHSRGHGSGHRRVRAARCAHWHRRHSDLAADRGDRGCGVRRGGRRTAGSLGVHTGSRRRRVLGQDRQFIIDCSSLTFMTMTASALCRRRARRACVHYGCAHAPHPERADVRRHDRSAAVPRQHRRDERAGHSVGGWMLGAALFFPMFALRGMGAGDVKLLAAVGAWLGPLPVVSVALITAIAGGVAAPGRVAGARLSPYRADEPVGAPDALAHQRNPAAARHHARGRTRPAAGVCVSDRDWDGDNAMAQILKTPCARWRSEDGAQLVEFALVLPMLLLVVLGIAEFGFIFQRYEVVTNAAREGARIASLPGYSNADVQARVAAYVTAGRVPTTGTNPVIAVTDVSIPTTPGGPVLTAQAGDGDLHCTHTCS